ncbi:MAG: hypothetical protein EOO09_13450 [Chitinophagaceae bacterium]|nr:MAG: hypothetical protein EOO09_13450 [Chitinophagaceae bacterium]
MKKYIINPVYLLALVAGFFLAGCEKDERDINMTISEVTQFYAPNDNVFVKLEPATAASVVFEWDQARAEDGSLVMYEVAFDKEGGNFTAPVYKMASDGNGVQPKLTLSHKDLNRIANFAGIGSQETGKLHWTILASKGTNVKQATLSRTIEVERPAGFAEIPTEVFLSGTATETGADLGTAAKLKSTSPGVFEIYTQLKPGTYHFSNRNAGSPTTFIIEGSALKEGVDGASPATAPTVYRMVLDFNNAAVVISEIVKVEYWFAPRNAVEGTLNYIGGSKYKAENVAIEFRQESWGRDERYKFRVTFKDAGGATFQEDWASSNRDNNRPDANTPAAWYNIFKQDVNQWDYTFKFRTEADLKNVDLTLDFSPAGAYSHKVDIK